MTDAAQERKAPADLAALPALLRARAIGLGAPLHLLETTTSTNDEAKRAAKDGAPHGAVWVAESQSAGRGRQGRSWVSPPGENLLFSVLVRLTCAPARLPPLALVAGLAARDAIAVAAPEADVRLKWPNDVVVGPARHKIAGVLVEATLVGGRVEAVVVGIGINVHARAFPEELAARATSVAMASRERPDRAAVLVDVLAALDRDLPLAAARGLGPLHARLLAADALRGQRVQRDGGEGVGEGVAEGIDVDGRLLVRDDHGIVARWGAGEVHLL